MSDSELPLSEILGQYREFCNKNPGFGVLLILDSTGNIEYTSEETFCSESQAHELLDAWLNHKSAVKIGDDRYAILNWEILQFAARNVHGKGALVGSKTKSNRYVIAHLKPEFKNRTTFAAIKLNRFSWNLI